MKVTAKKDALLANTENKKQFIAMLQRHLSKSGCRTLQAEGDADVLIVKTAIDSAVTHPTVLVGDDINPLVLLCYHTEADSSDSYFRAEAKASSREQSLEHAESEGGAWPGGLPQQVVFACHSGL